MEVWIDYSSGTVSGAAMEAARIAGAFRYVGIGGAGKRLTRAEYADHCAHGRQTVAVVEYTTVDADGGAMAGRLNAQAALADLTRITAGLPPITRVLMANDKPGWNQADVDYVRAAATVLGPAGYTVGPYGFGDFLTACRSAGCAPISWQAGPAPSRTGTSSIATWWQRQGGAAAASDGPASPVTAVIDGVVCDLSNKIGAGPVPAPQPAPPSYSGGTMRIVGSDAKFRTQAITDGFTKRNLSATEAAQAGDKFAVDDATWDYLEANTAAMLALPGQISAIAGSITAEEAALLAAIQAQPTGQVDVAGLATALAPVLVPLLPADATPAEIGAAVERALAEALTRGASA